MITHWEETADGGVTRPEGFRAAAMRCGLKTQGEDVVLIAAEEPAAIAGVFTTNVVKASCVTWSQGVVARGAARAIICNAGNANACNGAQGDRDNARVAELASGELGCEAEEVVVASTGIIGHPMPMERFEEGVPGAAAGLGRSAETDARVARAMMTTDTRPKQVATACRSDQWPGELHVAGVCKGSGMIAPNMATMLCFVTTDARIPAPLLQQALASAVEQTFNRMTVDGDTSTNDMVIVLASSAGGCEITAAGPAYDDFAEALERTCRTLAKEVARDGEGATKLVEIVVRGAAAESEAAQIARTVGESPLVKTALFGCDPNWGRVLMAAGRSGVCFDPRLASVRLGDILVFEHGTGVPFDAPAASAYLKQPEVRIVLDLHAGPEQATVWTCDFSYDYVRINAEYHT